MKKLAYQKCEQSGCLRQGVIMVQGKDRYIAVCAVCATKKKAPVGAKQGELV